MSARPLRLESLCSQFAAFAVIDVHLREETAEPIAGELLARGVPFVVTTGYANEELPPIFKDVPVLTKPVAVKRLLPLLHCNQRRL